MASIARKIQKRLEAHKPSTSTAAKQTVNGMVTRKINPATGQYQDFHYTKGWR